MQNIPALLLEEHQELDTCSSGVFFLLNQSPACCFAQLSRGRFASWTVEILFEYGCYVIRTGGALRGCDGDCLPASPPGLLLGCVLALTPPPPLILVSSPIAINMVFIMESPLLWTNLFDPPAWRLSLWSIRPFHKRLPYDKMFGLA